MKVIITFAFLISVIGLLSQSVQSSDSIQIIKESNPLDTILVSQNNSLDWLSGGNVNYFTNGYLRSTAEILRFNIGDPNTFYLPFYLLIGASMNVSETETSLNNDVAFELINQHGGRVNFGIQNKHKIKTLGDVSRVDLIYQIGIKSINAFVIEAGNKEHLFSKTLATNILFSTAVWSDSQPSENGITWINLGVSLINNPAEKMRITLGDSAKPTFMTYSIEGGIELSKLVKMQLGYIKVINQSDLPQFNQSMLKIALDVLI